MVVLGIAFLACGSRAAAADWRDTLDRKPGAFPILRSLVAHYEFGWSGIKAAEADAKFTATRSRCRLELDAKTIGAARTLWRMDAHGSAIASRATLLPVMLKQTEKYSRKSFRTTVNFSSKGVERLKIPTPPDETAAKVKRFRFSPVHDLHSALLFIRSQRLRKGDAVRLCVYPSTGAYFAEILIAGREKVNAAGREWDGIKCEIRLRKVEKDFTLTAHKKFTKATAWFSDDRDRLLLRIESEVFVGSVWAELKSVEFPK